LEARKVAGSIRLILNRLIREGVIMSFKTNFDERTRAAFDCYGSQRGP